MRQNIIISFSFLLLNTFCSFSTNRTWVGIGAGGTGTDFNASGNWNPAGVPTSSDNLTITLTVNSSYTINVTSNITVNNLAFTMNTSSGLRRGTLNVDAYTLTINGAATFNAVRYSSPISYDVAYLNINNGGTVIFNGNVNFHTTGDGDTYLITDFLGGGGANNCNVYFNGSNIQVGRWGRTVGAYEPNIIFNRTGAQTMVLKCAGGDYMFKAQDLTFGTTNTPTVTIQGKSSIYFDSYDGNMTISANTTVIVPDTTVTNSRTILDRYITGAGTCTMGANSLLRTGCPNDQPLKGFATYALNATSTVWYESNGWQDMLPITYGNVICDGLGGPAWKYSNGAQTMQGNFTVQNTAIYGPWSAGGLTVNGNTLFQTGATFNATRDNAVPSITHTFKGNFTNNATWTNGTPVGINTALFDGTANQTIGGSVSTNFYNLTCNKPSGTLYLGIKTSVGTASAGVMDFQAGALDLNGFRLIINNPATGAITRTSGYVISEQNTAVNNSILQWNIGATSGNHIFPFGTTDGYYIPVTFNNNGTSSGDVSISTRSTVASDNLPWAGVSNVLAVANMKCSFGDCSVYSIIDRWWDIQTGTNPMASGATLSLTYMGRENTITNPTQNIGFQHWNGTLWNAGTTTGTASGTYVSSSPLTAGGTSTNIPYTVSGSGFVYFSPYILVGLNPGVPLPVTLLSFTGECSAQNILLKWSTAFETNNAYFTIERGTEEITGQINWTPIGIKESAGNSSTIRNYKFIDESPFLPLSKGGGGIVYYHLKQTDLNGSTQIFSPIAVSCTDDAEFSVAVYPNPSDGDFQLSVTGAGKQKVLLVMRDVFGREVYSKTDLEQSNGIFFINPKSQLPAGVYTIIASSNDEIVTRKVVVK